MTNKWFACNRSTADFMTSSPLMADRCEVVVKDYSDYIHRSLVDVD